jgi:hypothetical protein
MFSGSAKIYLLRQNHLGLLYGDRRWYHIMLLYYTGIYSMVPIPEKRALGQKCNYGSIRGLGLIGFNRLPLLWRVFSDIYH